MTIKNFFFFIIDNARHSRRRLTPMRKFALRTWQSLPLFPSTPPPPSPGKNGGAPSESLVARVSRSPGPVGAPRSSCAVEDRVFTSRTRERGTLRVPTCASLSLSLPRPWKRINKKQGGKKKEQKTEEREREKKKAIARDDSRSLRARRGDLSLPRPESARRSLAQLRTSEYCSGARNEPETRSAVVAAAPTGDTRGTLRGAGNSTLSARQKVKACERADSAERQVVLRLSLSFSLGFFFSRGRRSSERMLYFEGIEKKWR